MESISATVMHQGISLGSGVGTAAAWMGSVVWTSAAWRTAACILGVETTAASSGCVEMVVATNVVTVMVSVSVSESVGADGSTEGVGYTVV